MFNLYLSYILVRVSEANEFYFNPNHERSEVMSALSNLYMGNAKQLFKNQFALFVNQIPYCSHRNSKETFTYSDAETSDGC